MAATRRNGATTVEKSNQTSATLEPGSPEWCRKFSASIRYFEWKSQHRVKVSVDGYSFEGSTVEEAAQLCDERLQRFQANTGRVLRPRLG